MLASCIAIEQPEFRPIGNSRGKPMAASVELQDSVAEAIVSSPEETLALR